MLLWSEPTEHLELMVRALNRGNIDNSFELARIIFDDDIFIVHDLEPLMIKHLQVPGTILQCDDKGMIIATSDGAVCVKKLITRKGESINADELHKRHQLKENHVLSVPSIAFGQKLQLKCEATSPDEVFCANAWRKAVAVPNRLSESGHIREIYAQLSAIPNEIKRNSEKAPLILIALALLLKHIIGDTVPVLYISSPLRKEIKGMESFFNSDLPFIVMLQNNKNVKDMMAGLTKKMEKISHRGLHSKDLFIRRKIVPKMLPLAIETGKNIQKIHLPDAHLIIQLHPSKNTFCITTHPLCDKEIYNYVSRLNFTETLNSMISLLSNDKNSPAMDFLKLPEVTLMPEKKTYLSPTQHDLH
ncbi:DNA-3-methyladenine glycosylase [Pedobacter lusitanus]|uniref:hypothetical protein n=1 Tax=Pedobacter lusitanus TaxID=1503925 RepID=UPI0021CFC9AC|nr:hypothetical protein [Pedobacter lusitanus]